MTRLPFLLALLALPAHGAETYTVKRERYYNQDWHQIYFKDESLGSVFAYSEKELAEDLAYALNIAHGDRMAGEGKLPVELLPGHHHYPVPTDGISPGLATYSGHIDLGVGDCTADNCGKASQ